MSGESCQGYYGGGWISSLQQLFAGDETIDLSLAFVTSQGLEFKREGNFCYYPIHYSKTEWQKIKEYYGGYKSINTSAYVNEVLSIVDEVKPDVIHVFGLENPLANVLGKLNAPLVVHLQGVINPIANAFWPVGINKWNFLLPPSKREWLLRNGFVYNYKSLKARAERELELFSHLRLVMGRTRWDKNVIALYAPQAKYFHVNEVLRPVFYDHQGEWSPQVGKFKILSVISETVYKGLDLVLKTSQLLTSLDFQFEWNVVGVNATDRIVGMFERILGVDSHKVNINYLGIMDSEKLCDTALASSLYVHTSYIDNSPNSLCEAQMLGLPVLSTNVGGISSLMDNCNLLQLVPANGVCELAHSIKQMHDNLELAYEIGMDGYEIAKKRHERDKIKNDLIEVYKSVLDINMYTR